MFKYCLNDKGWLCFVNICKILNKMNIYYIEKLYGYMSINCLIEFVFYNLYVICSVGI